MRNPKNWLWLILFGSLWGINEVVMGEVLSASEVPHFSVLLTVIAIFMLAIARGIVNKPGSSTVIGVIAVLFKLANAAPFHCHLLGIFMVGVNRLPVLSQWCLKRTIRIVLKISENIIFLRQAGER